MKELSNKKNLAEAIEAYKVSLESIPLGIGISDIRGKIIAVNKQFIELSGYSDKELMEKGIGILYVNQKDRRNMIKILKKNGRITDFEAFVKRKSGEIRTITFDASIVKINGHNVIFSIARDITAQKIDAEKLRAEKESYKGLFENSPEDITLLDKNGKIIFLNKKSAERLNLPAEECIGKNIWDFIPEKSAVFKKSDLRKIFVTRKTRLFDSVAGSGKGKKEYSLILHPILDKFGKIISVMVISSEITERKIAEENLKLSEEKYHLLVERVPIGIGLSDFAGRVYTTNHFFQKLTGFSEEEYKAQGAKLVYASIGDRTKLLSIIKKNGNVRDFEVKFKKKNGELLDVLLNVDLIEINGKQLFLFSARDITEKKKAEEELKQSEEKYHLLVERVPIGIGLSDPRGKVYTVNNYSQKLTGFSEEEYKSLGVKLAYGSLDERKKMLVLLKKNGNVRDFEVKFKKKNGELLDVLLNVDLIEINGKQLFLFSARDITEKKKAEEELKQSEAKNRGIISSLGDLLFVFDKEGKFTFYHAPKLEELYLSTKNFLGKSYTEVMPEHLNKLLKEAFEQNKLGKSDDFEYCLNVQGKIQYYYAKVSPLLLNSEFEGSVALVRNITEKKFAEESIKHLASFPRLSPSPVIETDHFGKVVFYNKTSMEILEKLKFDEISGKIKDKDFLDLIATKEFWENSKGILRELKFEGHIYDLSIYPFNEFDTVRLYGVDITEKKKAEEKLVEYVRNVEKEVERRTEELRTSEEEYGKLVNSMKEGLYSTDGKGKFLKVNKAMENIFGYSYEDISKVHPWELAVPEIQQEIKQKFIEKIIQKDFSPIEVECQKKNGKRFFVEIRISSITPDGGTFGLVLDITQRKEFELERDKYRFELEENLKRLNLAYQELQTLDQMKSDFLSITSHEIKTPITPLIIQTEILQRGDFGKLNDKQLESVSIIYRNINRLNKLITDLLELSRAQSGRIKLDKKIEDVNLLIDKGIETMQKESELKNIKITTKLEKLPPISLDAGKITQVIINLLSNAIKFGKKKGNIWIRSYKKEDNIFVNVKDDGLGIKKLDLEKVFKPFTQLGKIETKAKGSGLGLSICKDLIELHGGKIGVESPGIGKGTTFYFSLPLNEKVNEDKK